MVFEGNRSASNAKSVQKRENKGNIAWVITKMRSEYLLRRISEKLLGTGE